jgi:hypothetical protein
MTEKSVGEGQPVSLVMVDEIGTHITVSAADLAELRVLQRRYGAQGYRPAGNVPAGGYQLPYDLHDTFDWSLIGARPWISPEGDKGVFHDGHFYKQRLMEPVDSRKMKLPAAIKYSRGAKNTDADDVKEKAEGEFEYRSLILFRGRGLVRAEFQLPGRRRHVLAVHGAELGADAAD